MVDEKSHQTLKTYGRRGVLGGMASLLAASAYSLNVSAEAASPVWEGDDSLTRVVPSPDGRVLVIIDVEDGTPTYSVRFDGRTVVDSSRIGFEFQNQPAFGVGSDAADLEVTGSEWDRVDSTWEPVWDQYDEIEERYTELRIGLEETEGPGRGGTLEIRVFEDGFGFRFLFDERFGDEFVITSERTEYSFAGDYDSWWVPGDYNSFEYEYEATPLSEIGSTLESEFGGSFDGVHTPMTMRTDDDHYVSVHEANLDDYASLAITPQADGSTDFEAALAPLPDGTKVSASAPHVTPWRTIQLGRRPGDLIESNLIVNLNEDYSDDVFTRGTDWIEPQKFIGVWWLMITGRADWEYQGPQTGNHGAQTGRAKQYMDFASEHDIPGVLVEGWNQGWSSYPGDGSEFSFTESYPDFDLEGVTDYGSGLEPATQMTMHNETAGDFRNYESQLDEAFGLYDDLGIRTIKNGYVSDSGDLSGEGYSHHNQVLVNHHTLVAETAAANRQLLDVHEPIHPTGRRRTYPNLMTREGVKGQEYDAFGNVSPDHHVTFPFTRMLGGPVEYTPGIFDMESGSGGIETTRAKQLAMYPTYFSGLQMVADLPSSYLADQPATLGVGEVAQAQHADLDGFVTQSEWANAQGEAYVPFDANSVDSGSTATWTLEDAPAGEYDVHLRAANYEADNGLGFEVDATATLQVDGEPVEQLSIPGTDYWDDWTATATTVSLEDGDTELSLALTDEDTGGFNLDAIAVTETGAPMPEPDEPPITGPTVPAFQFVEDVPAAGWDDTRVLDSSIGDYMITARQKGDEWYVGAMTDENGRALEIPLDFLDSDSGHWWEDGDHGWWDDDDDRGWWEDDDHDWGDDDGPGWWDDDGHGWGDDDDEGHGWGRGNGHRKERARGQRNGRGEHRGRGHGNDKYVAEIYSDGVDADYDGNLEDVRIDEAIVDASTTLLASMVGSGGTAVRLRPATEEDLEQLPNYERPTQEVDVSIDDETFVREPFVSATGSNSGDYIGGTTVELVVDSDVRSLENVRFGPGATDESFGFGTTIDTAGTYDVTVRTIDGEPLASRTVTVTPPETVASFADSSGDDYGPGEYTYPTAGAFEDGVFDLRSFEVTRTSSTVQFSFAVETLNNAFGSDRGFSPHMFVLWLRDPAADGGGTTEVGDLGLAAEFESDWHYRLEVSGFTKSAVDAGGNPLTDADGDEISVRDDVDTEANTVAISVDRAAFGGTDISDLEVVAMVQSEDRGTLRPVAEDAADYVFGGAIPGAAENAPRIMDMVTPDDTSQADALAYSADQPAVLPFVPLGDG
ncbi:glycoside hydrolase family 97 catalytic domain-containing protein [Natrinema salsiterrestre]|uniref:Glycoside hydrolase family 97 catalytic domain-containing protein n=1 Tax=Natrinema salsiterrestre TaxID=2950540 RepID=A0A9Q4L3K0_9EURY|nr:glycoside hydrolase family 97 catalytic domain-containing protein [Natrinema salsiterrestre]MDF9746947.1 glycoside hydrolase family 97 catalytic domain-containing protein [Natrinema salsiterrestre]